MNFFLQGRRCASCGAAKPPSKDEVAEHERRVHKCISRLLAERPAGLYVHPAHFLVEGGMVTVSLDMTLRADALEKELGRQPAGS